MIVQFSRFVNSGDGLEKTLRLIQSVALIAAVLSGGSTAVRLTTAKLQLALSMSQQARTRGHFTFRIGEKLTMTPQHGASSVSLASLGPSSLSRRCSRRTGWGRWLAGWTWPSGLV